MSNTYMTIADIIKLRDENIYGLSMEVLQSFPLLSRIPVLTAPGSSSVIPRVTATPAAEFRTENTGRTSMAPPTIDTRTVTMKYLDGSWQLDHQTSSASYQSREAAVAVQTRAALNGLMRTAEAQILAGDSNVSGFDGLKTLVTDKVVDAGGSTSGGCSDLYIVNLNEGAKLVVGQDGKIIQSEIMEGRLTDSSGNPFFGYFQAIAMWAALGYINNRAVARVANIDAAKPLTDTMIFDALALMGEEYAVNTANTVVCMSLRSLNQLRKSRGAYNPVGNPVEFADNIAGIPILLCGTISNAADPEVVGS